MIDLNWKPLEADPDRYELTRVHGGDLVGTIRFDSVQSETLISFTPAEIKPYSIDLLDAINRTSYRIKRERQEAAGKLLETQSREASQRRRLAEALAPLDDDE